MVLQSFNYFFRIITRGQPTFFSAISSDNVVVTVFMFLHCRMQFIMTVFAHSYCNIVFIINVM